MDELYIVSNEIQVHNLLKNTNCYEYIGKFKSEKVDNQSLRYLTEDNVKELVNGKIGVTCKLWPIIKGIQADDQKCLKLLEPPPNDTEPNNENNSSLVNTVATTQVATGTLFPDFDGQVKEWPHDVKPMAEQILATIRSRGLQMLPNVEHPVKGKGRKQNKSFRLIVNIIYNVLETYFQKSYHPDAKQSLMYALSVADHRFTSDYMRPIMKAIRGRFKRKRDKMVREACGDSIEAFSEYCTKNKDSKSNQLKRFLKKYPKVFEESGLKSQIDRYIVSQDNSHELTFVKFKERAMGMRPKLEALTDQSNQILFETNENKQLDQIIECLSKLCKCDLIFRDPKKANATQNGLIFKEDKYYLKFNGIEMFETTLPRGLFFMYYCFLTFGIEFDLKLLPLMKIIEKVIFGLNLDEEIEDTETKDWISSLI